MMELMSKMDFDTLIRTVIIAHHVNLTHHSSRQTDYPEAPDAFRRSFKIFLCFHENRGMHPQLPC